MRYYLSGINSRNLAVMSLDAGIPNILVDPNQVDAVGLDLIKQFPHAVLDSGSYALWKQSGRQPDVSDVHRIWKILDVWGGWDFWVMPDAINIPQPDAPARPAETYAELTYDLWMKHKDRDAIPVWHWGEPLDYLRLYLTMHQPRVGIGGMVKILRGGHRELDQALKKALDSERTHIVAELEELLKQLIDPSRSVKVHLFAANHIPSAIRLAPLCTSMDSSKWLDAARYGYTFFIHERTGNLTYAPASAFGYEQENREERLTKALAVWKVWIERMEQRRPEADLHR